MWTSHSLGGAEKRALVHAPIRLVCRCRRSAAIQKRTSVKPNFAHRLRNAVHHLRTGYESRLERTPAKISQSARRSSRRGGVKISAWRGRNFVDLQASLDLLPLQRCVRALQASRGRQKFHKQDLKAL